MVDRASYTVGVRWKDDSTKDPPGIMLAQFCPCLPMTATLVWGVSVTLKYLSSLFFDGTRGVYDPTRILLK
jgi:hypothetical protein